MTNWRRVHPGILRAKAERSEGKDRQEREILILGSPPETRYAFELRRDPFDYVWVQTVPTGLVRRIGRTQLIQPLHTADDETASAIARLLSRQAARLFRWLGTTSARESDIELSLRRFEHWADSLASSVARSMQGLVPAEPAVSWNKTTGRHSSPLLSDVIQFYQDERREALDRHNRYRDEHLLQSFLNAAGDRPLNEIERSDVRRFKEILIRRPKNLRKHLPNLTPGSLLDLPSDLPRLSLSTVNSYLRAVSGFFEWSIKNGYADRNPARGLYVGGEKQPLSSQRQAYDHDELKVIFERSPLYLGAANHYNRMTPGNVVLRDHLYWAPLIALYSGMRLREIMGLNVSDIITRGSVSCFFIRPNDQRRLKTRGSERLVPIHPTLVELGLLRRAGRLKRGGEKRLFPEAPINASGDVAESVSRFWSRYRRAIGIEGDGKTFHSFRHTFINELRYRGVSPEVIWEVAGLTSHGKAYQNYVRRLPPKALAKGIAKANFGLNHPRFG